jgi:hypothetical protein
MDEENDSVAWNAVNALIENARADFRGERQKAFAWAVYSAVRRTDSSQLQNLRELLRKHGIKINPGREVKRSWVN